VLDFEVPPTEGAAGPKGGIQVDCSWGHRSGASALRLLTQLFLDEGVFGPYRSHFLSRKSLIAAKNETKEERRKIGERDITSACE
jgi:hypothetical protein